MDLDIALNQFSGIGDVAPPREIEVQTSSGVNGTLAVPHSVDKADFLQLGYAPPTHKMAVILHGQGGHRNYCYQKKLAHKLAAELGMYSLRIDFRGCGALADVADLAVGRTLQLDVQDIQAAAELVVDARKNPLNICFDLLAIVAHSRGSLAMFLWAVEQENLLQDPRTAARAIAVPNLINCSLRFRLFTVLDRYPIHEKGFEWMEQKALRHGEMRHVRITNDELQSLASADTAQFACLSPQWAVLSIYGTEDTIISKQDCAYYANIFNRGPYTHHLELIDGADHNFYGVKPMEHGAEMPVSNPHNLPLLKNKVINYNYVVCAMVVKYLRPDQELRRFQAMSRHIGGFPRVKHVDGISNFRDLGGWRVYKPTFQTQLELACKYFVRPNLMYRCANPAGVTEAGYKTLQDLGVKAIFDLRSEDECAKDGIPEDLVSVGIERIHAPVFKHEDYSPEAIALRLSHLITSWHTYVQIYAQILQRGEDLFRTMFEHLRDKPHTPLLFHCTAGKDRTGVFGMLVLLLAGVDKFTISKEYALTTYGLVPDHARIRERFLAGMKKTQSGEQGEALAQMILQGRKNWSIEVDGFNNLISSRAEAMLATIELLDTEYGGVLGYMEKHLKFSKEDIEAIFCNIMAKPDASVTPTAWPSYD
ncbi:hypothetical protein METBIDRAFT_85689 [Metschnikowia bicuspidata var. bicuspidata NRRL YB-4993]|uniref:Tyrosine specific protein phosphatases domain-containing protein n=1 Tax=Metschnikowia bicuspidata var. bicuspidata NRRL YB-4993 TaxID=869754 RepID=A0A1A0HHW0_9ASCO|nr:hypothetical protein METBIDRAFT_85689 [Metschnikowia bicuspidata var. bicuspidata NRRL YB-4993]OBA23467.1 hypothetical protein METBIDRAFT_85689 [Metschnikowia bicuspidata var. bicuspidata NRRL YB-4993]